MCVNVVGDALCGECAEPGLVAAVAVPSKLAIVKPMQTVSFLIKKEKAGGVKFFLV